MRSRWLIAVTLSIGLHGLLGLAWLSLCTATTAETNGFNTGVPAPDDEFTMQIREPALPRVPRAPALTPAAIAPEPGTLPSFPEPSNHTEIIPAQGVAPAKSASKSLHSTLKSGAVVVYVLDRSSSMGSDGQLTAAKKALRDSLAELRPDTRFQILAYNGGCSRFAETPVAGTPENIERGQQWVRSVSAEGKSDHIAAWREAFRCKPDALFVLTDADDLALRDVRTLRTSHKHSITVNVVLFTEWHRREKTPLVMWLNEISGSIRYAE